MVHLKKRSRSHHERYVKWFNNRSQAESDLHSLAFDFEDRYFSDVRLLTPSIRRQLLREGDGYEPEIDMSLARSNWIFRYRRSSEWSGRCVPRLRTIYIAPGLSDSETRATLLHEMIHAYESILPVPYRDWLLLELHKRLSSSMGPARLRRYTNVCTHAAFQEGGHALFLLLKSLDLDQRFKWSPGTVFAYGRLELFANS